MSLPIKDGTGTGAQAKVDASNRLAVLATTQSIFVATSIDGEAFSIPTDVLARTAGAGSQGLFFITNEGQTDLAVDLIRVSSDQAFTVRVVRNPTGGTMSTAGTEQAPVPLNLGSSKSLSINSRISAADGQTIIGGTLLTQAISPAGVVRVDAEGAVILGQNDSLGVLVELAADGNVAGTLFLQPID